MLPALLRPLQLTPRDRKLTFLGWSDWAKNATKHGWDVWPKPVDLLDHLFSAPFPKLPLLWISHILLTQTRQEFLWQLQLLAALRVQQLTQRTASPSLLTPFLNGGLPRGLWHLWHLRICIQSTPGAKTKTRQSHQEHQLVLVALSCLTI